MKYKLWHSDFFNSNKSEPENKQQTWPNPWQHKQKYTYINLYYMYTSPVLHWGQSAQSAHTTTSREELKTLLKQLKKQHKHTHPLQLLLRSKCLLLSVMKAQIQNLWARKILPSLFLPLHLLSIWYVFLFVCVLVFSFLKPINALRTFWQDSQGCCSQTWVASVTLSGGQT